MTSTPATDAHTPAPWLIAPHESRRVVRADGRSIAWCGTYPEDEAIANARLIAAAPDLLDALRAVLAAERFSARSPETVQQAEAKLDHIRAAAVKADAAIAKAEGHTSEGHT